MKERPFKCIVKDRVIIYSKMTMRQLLRPGIIYIYLFITFVCTYILHKRQRKNGNRSFDDDFYNEYQ